MYVEDYGKHYSVSIRYDLNQSTSGLATRLFYDLDLVIEFIQESFLRDCKMMPRVGVQFFNNGEFCNSCWLINKPSSTIDLDTALKSFRINMLDRFEPLKISPKVANRYRVAGTDFHYSFQNEDKLEVGDSNDSRDIPTSSRGLFSKIKEFFAK